MRPDMITILALGTDDQGLGPGLDQRTPGDMEKTDHGTVQETSRDL